MCNNQCAGCDHLRQVFGTQMGLSDKDIVALSGGHTLVCVDGLPFDCNLTSFPDCNFKVSVWMVFNFCREGATRSDLDLKVPGPPTL